VEKVPNHEKDLKLQAPRLLPPYLAREKNTTQKPVEIFWRQILQLDVCHKQWCQPGWVGLGGKLAVGSYWETAQTIYDHLIHNK